jgi:hypothetical protein
MVLVGDVTVVTGKDIVADFNGEVGDNGCALVDQTPVADDQGWIRDGNLIGVDANAQRYPFANHGVFANAHPFFAVEGVPRKHDDAAIAKGAKTFGMIAVMPDSAPRFGFGP